MVRNVECCPLFEVTNTVLELVKVHPLPSGKKGSHVTHQRSRYPCGLLTAALSDYGAELLKKQQGIAEGPGLAKM